MAHIIPIKGFGDDRGSLHVLQDQIPFDIKRVYYIHFADETVRGGHRHHQSDQVLICISGSCLVYLHDGQKESEVLLDAPGKALFVDRKDWHTMTATSPNTILLVLANTFYDVNDYIDERYPNH